VDRHVLAPTVEAGAAPMQALLTSDGGEPNDAVGSPADSVDADEATENR
jgi:hypothetical protein